MSATNKMKWLTITLSEEHKNKLRALAKKERRNLSQTVRIILEDFLKAQKAGA